MNSRTLCTLLLVLLTSATAASAGTFTAYDVTRTFMGTGTETFPQYEVPAAVTVTEVTVSLVPPTMGSMSFDNENDVMTEVTIDGRSYDVTLTSTDAPFTPVHYDVIGIGQIIQLAPHDDPDGIDTLDAFQADSGNDWIQTLTVAPLPVTSTVSDPAGIAAFLGTGTFDIDCLDASGPQIMTLPPPGVSSLPVLISAGYKVNVTMTAVPEPGTLALVGLGIGALLRRRRLR
jgi:hypothetical protein